jgi:hypothetical protein
MQEVAAEDKRIDRSVHSVNPARRDDHGVTGNQLDLDNLVHHVPKPDVVLQLCTGPSLVSRQVRRCGPDKVEDLRDVSSSMPHRLIPARLGSANYMIINRRARKVHMPILEHEAEQNPRCAMEGGSLSMHSHTPSGSTVAPSDTNAHGRASCSANISPPSPARGRYGEGGLGRPGVFPRSPS